MKQFDRISFNPNIMGGKPIIRGMRVTVAMVVGLVASGLSFGEILEMYPYLEEEDIRQALGYAAWRAEEIEIPIPVQETVQRMVQSRRDDSLSAQPFKAGKLPPECARVPEGLSPSIGERYTVS